MIREQPTWCFSARYDAPISLLENRVVGIWFCLDRTNGQYVWQSSPDRANTIVGESNGVIVATELVTYTATITRGCYGIDLETGKLLWTSHANGFWGIFWRICDFVPGFINDFSDSPIHVENGRVIMESGRILDVHTGKQIERISRKKAKSYYHHLSSPEHQLFDKRKFLLEDGTWLTHMLPEKGQQIQAMPAPRSWLWADFFDNGFQFYRLTQSGDLIWSFQPEEAGCHYVHKYRLELPNYVYLILSEEKTTTYDHETKQHEHCLSKFHFVSISIETGKIVQDFLIDETPLAKCNIEDVDARGVLISSNETDLWHKYENRLPSVFRYYEKI